MILLDTNVLIYASTDGSPFLEWARRTIAAGVSADGAAINAISLAEICVGDADRTYFPSVSLRTPGPA